MPPKTKAKIPILKKLKWWFEGRLADYLIYILSDKFEEIETDLDTMSDDIIGLQKDIADLDSKVDDLED